MVSLDGVGPVPSGKLPKLPPAAALLPGAVAAPAYQQQIPVIAEGQAGLGLVHIHAAHIRGVLQGDDIGAVLVQLQKIAAVLVEEGEVGGHDDLFGPDRSMVGDGGGAHQFPHGRVLIDAQTLGDGGDEFQGVELGLMGELDRPGHRKGEGEPLRKFPMGSQFFQGGQLPLHLPPAVQGIGAGGLVLKAAVHVPAQRPVFLEGGLVGGEVLPGTVHAEPPDELVVDQPVLAGEFCGGVFGDAAAQGLGLHQHIGHPGTVQPVGAQHPRHAAADDQHISAHIAVQDREARMLPGPLPQ